MNPIDQLALTFSHLPGIGPRQARRFVYFLLSRPSTYASELVRNIEALRESVHQCTRCMRFYAGESAPESKLCTICRDPSRDASLLMVLPRDTDLDALEKSHSFRGLYFVLGGALPILEKEPEKRIRIKDLESRIKNDTDIREIIIAMNATAEGENTAEHIRALVKDMYQGEPLVQITELGRGLSTGAELEYADPETLKNALLHRTR